MQPPKAIIGLGNPGPKFYHMRHNIGFRIIDALADRYHTQFKPTNDMEVAQITIDGNNILLIKPQTFMNNSGKVIPFLHKKGIKPDQILVIHDELELPFGSVKFKMGGSAKGHNGLRSIISFAGSDFARLRVGIDRPERKEEVSEYVLHKFHQSVEEVEEIIHTATEMIKDLYQKKEGEAAASP